MRTPATRRRAGSGPPLGVVPGVAYRAGNLTLGPGDVLLLYTDGLTDAAAPRGERYGVRRPDDALLRHGSGGAEAVQAGVLGDLRCFLRGAQPHDDVALLLLERASRVAGANVTR